MADHAYQLMVVEGGEVAREYRKGNWTLQETMVLIEAKRMDKERRTKRGGGAGGESSAAAGGRPSELRWKWVEDYCWRHGCHRSQNQCNDKWDNLMRDYKKVRNYEEKVAGVAGGEGSYWKLESHERKERNLPSNFLPQVYEALYDVMERRGGGSGGGAHGAVDFAAAAEERLMGGVPSTSLPLLVQQPPSAPAQEPSLRPPIPPPPPPQNSPPHPQVLHELDSDDDTEHSSSPPRKRMREGGRREGRSGGGSGSGSGHELLGSAISKGAAMLAEALMANEEREETRHRDLLIMKERKLKMEQSRAETSAEAMAGLVTAINRLASSIQGSVPHRNPRAPE
ncbi:hypothetical protein Taro_040661 [Colocasia esculenta]|uniref:Myb-like domain-containing protein n=1 Tax=Colocasia esculenta TaxID=4460 RepID=A0A843WJC8_COLES|nr:hypothetical protein [Colocasia esculenta]